MVLFLSTYINKVDKKGRVSVPAPFRAVLTGQHLNGIVIYPSFIHDCIEACGIDRIEQLNNSIDQLDPYGEERDAFATTILGGSLQLSFDGEGRVVLPSHLLTMTAIDEQALFIGKGHTFEIWQPERFNQYAQTARDIAKKHRGTLRLASKEQGTPHG